MAKTKLQQIADQLYKLREEIDAFEAPIKPMKAKEDELREEMLAELRRVRLESFRTEDGLSYVRAYRASLTVTDPAAALAWAVERQCAKVDTLKAAKLLKGAGALPEGFEQKETEYLSIRAESSNE
jgi:hypothetical protein